MPNPDDKTQAITDTVNRYIATVVNGSADDLAGFYADDGDHKMRVEPIEVMVFDDRGKVTAMKAYWSAADITQL